MLTHHARCRWAGKDHFRQEFRRCMRIAQTASRSSLPRALPTTPRLRHPTISLKSALEASKIFWSFPPNSRHSQDRTCWPADFACAAPIRFLHLRICGLAPECGCLGWWRIPRHWRCPTARGILDGRPRIAWNPLLAITPTSGYCRISGLTACTTIQATYGCA